MIKLYYEKIVKAKFNLMKHKKQNLIHLYHH